MSPTYTLFPQDLGELLHLQSLISSEILSPDLPTLFIAECVFPYMSLEQTDRVLKWFSDNFKILGGVVYEMFGLTDKFGMVMRENLKVRLYHQRNFDCSLICD
jgi:[phosphatase 2A protein]-leucine-carboxy methyltransferase